MIQHKAKYIGHLGGSETESEDVDFTNYLKGADWIVYSYMSGSWEGDGVAIHKENGKLFQSNIGHCSCYGPQEQLSCDSQGSKGYDTLEDLLKDCSESLKKELRPVLDVIEREKLCV